MKAADFLKHLPIFQAFSEVELEQLEASLHLRKLPKHTLIYTPGNRSESVYFLVKGTVKIGTTFEEGREVIKNVLHPMAMFGELCLVGEEKRRDFAMSMNEEVHIYSLNANRFQELLRNNSKLAMNLLTLIGSRLQKAEQRLESMILKDARERIIDFLKDSADKRGKKVGFEMLIKHSLTQQDIANITGTSRQTVTSVLNDLRKANLIYFNRRSILIRDVSKLS